MSGTAERMLLYDLSHTSHSRARTGVQRVALELRRALTDRNAALAEITHDPHAQTWRFLRHWEKHALDAPPTAAKRRGAYWPLLAQIRGHCERVTRHPSTAGELPAEVTGFFTPEIFTARTGRNLPELFQHIKGPKVALFHDAISLRMPHLTPSSAVGRFPSYMAELHDFDGIMTISEDSKQSLLSYWDWAGWRNGPEVTVLPLGLDHLPAAQRRTPPPPPTPSPVGEIPTILCVGSLEGRKNHLTLIEACEKLWASGEQFILQMIGTLQRDTGRAALNRLRELQAQGRAIRYDGWLNDEALEEAFEQCAFTVYPSLLEGFGLPVWESLLHGKPCVCSSVGATGETAAGGGCLATDTRTAEPLAKAIHQLLHDVPLRNRLADQALSRNPPRWTDCAEQLLDWMRQLPQRAR